MAQVCSRTRRPPVSSDAPEPLPLTPLTRDPIIGDPPAEIVSIPNTLVVGTHEHSKRGAILTASTLHHSWAVLTP